MATMKSPVWGNTAQTITQAFGVNEPGVPDWWYAYVEDWGLPYGTHGALDIQMDNGTKLYAPVAGKVVFGGENLEYFRPGYVEIEYKIGENTERLILAHMNQTAVATGEHVTAGQFIGLSGEQTTRGSRVPDGSGPHLHAERRDITRQKLLDPGPILTGSKAIPTDEKSNWPTADKINAWIEVANKSNAPRKSPVTGMGADFVSFGDRYGVNPGIVTAIMQRESQMGADGSHLPTVFNNYAGITAVPGSGVFFGDREWRVFASPRAGLEAVFKLLDSDDYRATGGRLEDIMNRYAPPHENEWGPMFNTFRVVGDALGIVIDKDTNIYERGGVSADGGGGGIGGGLIQMVGEAGPQIGFGAAGVVVLIAGLVVMGGKFTPVGRAIGAVKKVAS